MKILFIGGTGTISSSSLSAAIFAGHDVFVLCRGTRNERLPKDVQVLTGDAYQLDEEIASFIHRTEWDCVINWTVYQLKQAWMDIERFKHNTRLYFLISSSSVYDNSNAGTAIVETQAYHHSTWHYSKNKMDVEQIFLQAYQTQQFPVVIVRPGHTYNDFTVPTNIQGLGYGFVKRILAGEPALMHDDGLSRWTLTHSDDFAQYFIQLFDKQRLMGEIIHIATEEHHTWESIFSIYADLLDRKIHKIYLPSQNIYLKNMVIGEPIVNDKKFDRIFNITKLKNIIDREVKCIPLTQGLERVIRWHRIYPERIFDSTMIEKEMNKLMAEGLVHAR